LTGDPRRRRRPAPANLDVNPRLARQRRGSARRAPTARPPRPRRSPLRGVGLRLGATIRLAVLAAEVAGLVFVVTSPAFATESVDVSGARHLTQADVLREARLAPGQSIFLLDTAAAERRLETDSWVLSATVRAELPRRVVVDVTERRPFALLQQGGAAYLMDALGVVLGPSVGPAPALVVTSAATLPHAPGAHALSARLVENLARIEANAATLFKSSLTITGWELSSDYQLTADTSNGLRILFGQMATPEQMDSLDAKVAALSAQVDFAHECYSYVNVENPHVIACGVKPSPSPTPKPSPSPSASPHH